MPQHALRIDATDVLRTDVHYGQCCMMHCDSLSHIFKIQFAKSALSNMASTVAQPNLVNAVLAGESRRVNVHIDVSPLSSC